MSDNEDIQKRMQAAMAARVQREDEAKATRDAEAEVRRADFQQFVSLVDREILPAMTEFRDLAEQQGVHCEVELKNIRDADSDRGPHSVTFKITYQGRVAIYGGPKLELAHYPTRLGRVLPTMTVQIGQPAAGGRQGDLPYDHFTKRFVLELLTSLFEQALKYTR